MLTYAEQARRQLARGPPAAVRPYTSPLCPQAHPHRRAHRLRSCARAATGLKRREPGAQFTCFTSRKVHPKLRARGVCHAAGTQFTCFTSRNVQILTPEELFFFAGPFLRLSSLQVEEEEEEEEVETQTRGRRAAGAARTRSMLKYKCVPVPLYTSTY